jgi:hypothetical protein
VKVQRENGVTKNTRDKESRNGKDGLSIPSASISTMTSGYNTFHQKAAQQIYGAFAAALQRR